MLSISVNRKQNGLAFVVGGLTLVLGIASHNTRAFWFLRSITGKKRLLQIVCYCESVRQWRVWEMLCTGVVSVG